MHRLIRFALAALAAGCAGSPAGRAALEAEIVRDAWGIAHVYGSTETAAWFGAGYACAQDRLKQLDLNRRTVQGRLAEILGPRWTASDRKFRTLGLYAHAQKLAATADPVFDAYARGVNAAARERAVDFEPWTAADCLAMWLRIEERFAGGWASEAAPPPERDAPARVVDESGVVVPEAEFERTAPDAYRELKEMKHSRAPTSETPMRASHAWAVSGARSTTGKPILESDPQIQVTFPPLWYEVHVSGGALNARGIGMPGAPGFLVGWNERLAWGASALGSDAADLVAVDGPFEERTETIRVKGAADETLVVRTSRHGPVVTPLIRDAKRDFALQWIALERPSSLEGMVAMPRARSLKEFERAMERYHSPGLHIVYADADGTVAYRTLATIPLRSCRHGSRAAHEESCEWGRTIPFRLMPHMTNPAAGFVSHANNTPVGAWYPFDLYGGGDTPRSWRLREILSSREKFSPADFLSVVHRDTVNPQIRDFVRFAGKAMKLDEKLAAWDGRCGTDAPASVVAIGGALTRSLRAAGLSKYGGGDSGVAHLLKTIARDESLLEDAGVRRWLEGTLRQATEGRGRGAAPQVPSALPWQTNLEGFGSLAPECDLPVPPLSCTYVQTIWSQLGNSYTQVVDLSDVDASVSLLPPGVSEDPASPHSRDQVGLWAEGGAHPAPLTRAAVEKIARSRRVARVD